MLVLLVLREVEVVRAVRGADSAGVAGGALSTSFRADAVCSPGSTLVAAAFLVVLLRVAAVADFVVAVASERGETGASPCTSAGAGAFGAFAATDMSALAVIVAAILAVVAAVDAARRRVVVAGAVVAADFVSGSGLPGVALSDFERAAARVLVAAGLTCSFSSVVSDISFMKKTSLYGIMRQKWRRKSLFTATTKDCRLFPYLNIQNGCKEKKGTVPRRCSARHVLGYAHWRRCYG